MIRLFKVVPQRLNRIQVRSLTSFCFALAFRGGLAAAVLLQDVLVDGKIHGFIFHCKSSGPEAAAQTITPPTCPTAALFMKHC